MRGDLRCIEGRLFRHDPQADDPDLETDVGECPDCSGDGCGDDGEPVAVADKMPPQRLAHPSPFRSHTALNMGHHAHL